MSYPPSPGGPTQAYPPQPPAPGPAWQQAATPPVRRSGAPWWLVAVVGVVALVLGCGAGAVFMAAGQQPTTPSASSTPSKAAAAAAVEPTAAVPTEPAAAPTSAVPTKPAKAKVPNLVGLNAAVALDKLKRLGFDNVDFGSTDPDDKVVLLPSNWTVAEQSEPAGKTVATDTLIVLTCDHISG